MEYSPEMRWLLHRAFGPVDRECSGPLDPSRVVSLAQVYDLGPRIASRLGGSRIAREAGRDAARSLTSLQLEAEAQGRRLLALVPRLAQSAAARGIPLVFLKYVALRLQGITAPGSRTACDVDVLVSRKRAREFQAGLLSEGFEVLPRAGPEYHLRQVRHSASGVVVEVHLALNAVNLDRGWRHADAENMDRAGLLRTVDGGDGRYLVPHPQLQAAYVVAHGFAQHGDGGYPLTRTVADLVDLAESDGDELLKPENLGRYVSRHLSQVELQAACALVRALRDGDDSVFDDRGQPERVVLDHIAAVPVDNGDKYSREFLSVWRSPSELPPVLRGLGRLWFVIATVFFPSAAALGERYGEPRSRLREILQRAYRPLELAWRLIASLVRRPSRDTLRR